MKIEPIHLFELGGVALFGVLAARNFARAQESEALATRPENALVASTYQSAASTYRSSALTNGAIAAGLLGLTIYTWNDPWGPITRTA